MKRNIIIICISVFILAVLAYAERPELQRDGRGYKLQSCAPDIANDASLTGNSQNVNITDANCYMVYASADIKFREMTSATVTGVQHTITGGNWYIGTPTSKVKYLNLSSATSTTGTVRSDKP